MLRATLSLRTRLLRMATTRGAKPVDTLIFDLDDCIYGRDTGFTTHRNGELVARFMVDVVGFESADEAMTLRNEYFERFHSTFKSLSQMELDGKLPKNAPPNPQKLLGDYWAANAEFRKFLQPDSDFVAALKSLPQKKVLFSNGPRNYCLRCLETLEIREFFPDDQVFCVDDVAPSCKPEPEAFAKVFAAVGAEPSRCVMFEDSIKNLQTARALGMTTIFVSGPVVGGVAASANPAIDYTIAKVGELKTQLPSLWDGVL